jgi:hypothetical protein
MKYPMMNTVIRFFISASPENSGLNRIEIKATGGWHAAMAQMLLGYGAEKSIA